MSFTFFTKRYRLDSYAALKFDLHNHTLPGIDDGAATVAESVSLLGSLHQLGFEKCIATPHVSVDYYPNEPRQIFDAFDLVIRNQTGLPPHFLHAVAAEYLVDEGFADKIKSGALLTLPGRRVLFELPFSQAPMWTEELIFLMTSRGYTPVLAHPERYRYWYGSQNGQLLQRLVDLGCELQVNLLSLLGYYGTRARKAGYEILDAFPVNFLATDCHKDRQVTVLREGLQDRQLAKLMSRSAFDNASLFD